MLGKLRRSGIARLVLAAQGIAVAALALAEVGARALFDAPPERYVKHPLVGPGWAPNYSFEQMSVDVPPVPFTLEVNPLGFRGKAMRTAKKPAGTFRIFCIGASTVENALLPEERTFPGRLQTALDAKGKFEVVNAGVAGMNGAVVTSMLLHRVLPLEPDLVIVLDGHNDLVDTWRKDWEPHAALPRPEPPPTFKDWLIARSRLMAVLEARGKKHKGDKRWWYEARQVDRRARPFTQPDFPLDRGVASFKTILRRIALLCSDAKVRCVFLTQPSLYKDSMTPEEEAALHMGCFGDGQNFDTKTLKTGMDLFNEAIREVAKDQSCEVVDLARLVPGTLENFVDDVHMTSKGNEAVARAILENIKIP